MIETAAISIFSASMALLAGSAFSRVFFGELTTEFWDQSRAGPRAGPDQDSGAGRMDLPRLRRLLRARRPGALPARSPVLPVASRDLPEAIFTGGMEVDENHLSRIVDEVRES